MKGSRLSCRRVLGKTAVSLRVCAPASLPGSLPGGHGFSYESDSLFHGPDCVRLCATLRKHRPISAGRQSPEPLGAKPLECLYLQESPLKALHCRVGHPRALQMRQVAPAILFLGRSARNAGQPSGTLKQTATSVCVVAMTCPFATSGLPPLG